MKTLILVLKDCTNIRQRNIILREKKNEFVQVNYTYGLILSWAPFLGLPMSFFHGQVFGSQNFQKQIIAFLKDVPGF